MSAHHRLDLIDDEQGVMLCTKFADLGKVSFRWDDNSCFTLDGLEEDCCDVLAIKLERSSDVFNFAISNGASRIAVLVRRTYAGEVRAESISAVWVCAHAGHVVFVYGKATIKGGQRLKWRSDLLPDDTYGPAVEIACSTENDSATFGDAFLFICPFTRELDAGFDGLGACVHWEDHVIPKHLGDLFRKGTKNGVVECPRGKGEALGLLHQGGHDAGVAVPLIDGPAIKVSSGIEGPSKNGRAALVHDDPGYERCSDRRPRRCAIDIDCSRVRGAGRMKKRCLRIRRKHIDVLLAFRVPDTVLVAHQLCSIRHQSHSRGTECPVEDDWEWMIASK